MLLSFCASSSCNSMPRSGCSALHGVNHNFFKKKGTSRLSNPTIPQADSLTHLVFINAYSGPNTKFEFGQ